jgi:tetratricopeptide (TPR) repeat protein
MYNKAIQGEIDNKESVYQNLGHCYLLKNDIDKAMLAYQEAIRLNRNFIEPHIYLGHSYLKKGMKDKAIKEYEIFLKYGQDDKQIKMIRALISELNRK